MAHDKIVFYDSDCGFCNRSVNFVLKSDKSKKILFVPLQSEFTKNLFDEKGFEKPDLSTFYFYENERMFIKSTAALKLTKHFKFPQRLLAVNWIVPRFIRDYFYNLIAKRRQRLSKGYCVVPSEEDKKRFL